MNFTYPTENLTIGYDDKYNINIHTLGIYKLAQETIFNKVIYDKIITSINDCYNNIHIEAADNENIWVNYEKSSLIRWLKKIK